MSNEFYRRLESRQPFGSLQRGFRAEVHDPVWFLGRQWQMGEHQGEDASSPVEVMYVAEHLPLAPHLANADMDPTVVPPEAIIESEPDDWWTPGRRIRLGQAFAEAHGLAAVGSAGVNVDLLLSDLPVPYDVLNGRGYDGLKLFLAGDNASDAVFTDAGVPVDPPSDLWGPDRASLPDLVRSRRGRPEARTARRWGHRLVLGRRRGRSAAGRCDAAARARPAHADALSRRAAPALVADREPPGRHRGLRAGPGSLRDHAPGRPDLRSRRRLVHVPAGRRGGHGPEGALGPDQGRLRRRVGGPGAAGDGSARGLDPVSGQRA